jgi:hypothetical protein
MRWRLSSRSEFPCSLKPCARMRAKGNIGMQLGEIAKANPGVAIGSYPFFDPQHGPNTNVVLRARDAQKLVQAKRAVEDMLERVRRAQSSSPLGSANDFNYLRLVLQGDDAIWGVFGE